MVISQSFFVIFFVFEKHTFISTQFSPSFYLSAKSLKASKTAEIVITKRSVICVITTSSKNDSCLYFVPE